MVLKIAHIYACNAKMNSGDFMIGKAYKKYFSEIVLNNQTTEFTDFDARNPTLYNDTNISKLNNYDYILVGGGGLILPDSAPNSVSCWQWIISKNNIEKIHKPIYVSGIGFNLFYTQTILMPNRNNDFTDPRRLNIFKENISTLIEKSTKFTLRHRNDLETLLSIVGEQYRSKLEFEFCHTIWYANKYWKSPSILEGELTSDDKTIAIEIKDDRKQRRYYNTSESHVYSELLKFVKYLQDNNYTVYYLSHDGSRSFYHYLTKHKINVKLLDNSKGNEKKIKENYAKFNTIVCTAGHSQMISYGLNKRIISLVTHPKVLNFCLDIENSDYVEVNKDKNIAQKLETLL